MRRDFALFLILIIIFTAAGCEKPKQNLSKSSLERADVKRVSSVNLAEAILLPKQYQFKFTRDPFLPLAGELPLACTDKSKGPVSVEPEIKVVGILVMEGRSRALLQLPSSEVGVFKQGDKIDGYTVKKIESKRVILEKADKTFILEIREEK